MNVFERRTVNVFAFAFDVGHLPADQRVDGARSGRDLADYPYQAFGVAPRSVGGQYAECLS